MLNYAETTQMSIIVPVTPLPSDQYQEPTSDSLMSLLSVLFTHPDFQQGVHDCLELYFDLYDEAPLTEEEMIGEIETGLSRRTVQADKRLVARLGGRVPPYLEKLGWVIGTIAKGLTYTQAQQGAEAANQEQPCQREGNER